MTTGAAVPLQYDVSRGRALTSWRDFPALVRVVVEAALAAVPIAVVVFFSLLYFNALVTFVIGLAQGAFVGQPLRSIFRRARVRDRSIAMTIAIGAGVFSALLVYMALYVRQAYAFQTQLGAHSHIQDLLAAFGIGGTHPYRRLSAYTTSTVGHGGFLGYMLFRFHQSSSFANLVGCHTLLTAFLTWRTSRRQITAPFCSACEQWLGPAKNVAVAPTWLLGELMTSIVDRDAVRAIDVARKSADADLGGGCAIARVRVCPNCAGNYAEVVVKSAVHTGRGVAHNAALKLPPTHITEELIRALRSEPVLIVEEPALPLSVPSPGTPGEG